MQSINAYCDKSRHFLNYLNKMRISPIILRCTEGDISCQNQVMMRIV